MKLVAVQLVLIAALILTLNITLTLGQNDVTLLENEEDDDNIIEKDSVSQYLQKIQFREQDTILVYVKVKHSLCLKVLNQHCIFSQYQ